MYTKLRESRTLAGSVGPLSGRETRATSATAFAGNITSNKNEVQELYASD